MDAGTAQIITAIVGAVSAIVGGVIAGYFTVKAAQVEASNNNNLYAQSISWIKLIILTVVLGVFAIPLAFIIAYIGNSLSGTPQALLIGDSIDSAINGGLAFAIGFILGTIVFRSEMSWGKLLAVSGIIAVLSAPTWFTLAFIGNLIDRVPPELLFSDSLDSAFTGGIFCGIGLVFGARLLKGSLMSN